jgi:hypothetical protein
MRPDDLSTLAILFPDNHELVLRLAALERQRRLVIRVLEHRSGAVASDSAWRRAERGTPGGDLQSIESLQLGQSGPPLGGGGNANTANFDAGNFGQITTQAGTPRIFQFGIKYMF